MIETKFQEMFGTRYPIASAPMGPFFTTELATTVSEKGGLGVLSHVNLVELDPVKEMFNAIDYVVEHTDKPFGINIRTARLQIDAPAIIRRLPRLIKNSPRVREQLVYVLTSAGGPREAAKVFKAKAPSVKHFHVGPTMKFVDKIVSLGCDGVVCTGYEGGGHQSYEKVNSTVLLAEACAKYPDVPIIACGGFANGRGLAAALSYGAIGIATGTRFIASKQCEFHPNYKQLVLDSTDQDTTIAPGYFAPIRLIRNEYTETHGEALDRDEKIKHDNEVDREAMVAELRAYESIYTHGDTVHGAIPAGQTVGLVDSVESVEDILDTIEKEAEAMLRRAASYLK
ncbi:MAG: NAD(P)H-dependent flavin oxidoreductase [Promethearchaeota archaeon]